MVETRNTMRGLDTGQLSSVNRLETSKKHQTKLEVLKSAKNQQSNDKNNETANDEENVVMIDQSNVQQNDQRENKNDSKKVSFQEEVTIAEENNDQSENQSIKKGLAIEVVMETGSSDQSCAVTVVHAAEQLLNKWTKMNVIEGVHSIEKKVIRENYNKVEE